jgi:uncharacterized phiE125 gp8 family phage protein
MAGLKIEAAPSVEPIALTLAKQHLRILDTETEEDDLIQGYIIAARSYAESFMNRAIIKQTWKLYLDTLTNKIVLPKADLISVGSFKIIDESGTEITVDTSDYLVNTASFKGSIIFKENKLSEYSVYELKEVNGVEIQFDAGYGDTADDVPGHIKQGLLLLIGHMYENRENSAPVNLIDIPFGVTALLGIDRVVPL